MDKEAVNRPLRVGGFIATKAGDPDRGPVVMMHPDDAKTRMLADGDLAWVYGPRRHDLAKVKIDHGARLGDVTLQDIVGAAPSEIVRVVKPELDSRGRRPAGA